MTLALTRPRSSRLARAAERIDAATPAHRDRAVDALRAFGIVGVVLGHWLVTALVAGDPHGADGTRLHVASPLSAMPKFAPVSWPLQTLALFFFVGGYSGAKGLRRPYGTWIRERMLRFSRPAAALLLAWVPAVLLLDAAGLDPVPLVKLVLSPLWFLCVYAALTAATPLLRRAGPAAALVPAAVVALVDFARFGSPEPWSGHLERLGWLNVLAGWLVPYVLGVAWANGALRSRRTAVALLLTGVAGTAALVTWCGYPAAMVGVPGAAISNLNPPTLAAVTFGLAQVGLALLVKDRLARGMRRPLAWAVVALTNLSAMTVFCWHQTALMLVVLAGLGAGPLPGLHDAPDHPGWIPYRLVWLPVFALTLAGLWAGFHRVERTTPRRRPSPPEG